MKRMKNQGNKVKEKRHKIMNIIRTIKKKELKIYKYSIFNHNIKTNEQNK